MRLLQYSDVENAYDHPERIARLAGLLEDRRTPETLVVGSGDDTAPGVLSLVSEGKQALPFFEAVQPDFETLGNHDFDYGPAAIREVIAASPQTWVSANVFVDGERFGAEEGVVPSALVQVDGKRVGVVGVLDAATPGLAPTASPLEVTDHVETVERETTRLRDRGADEVVVLSHTGDDEGIASEVDVDVILGGHVHEPRIDRVGGTLLTRPGAGANHVVEVDLDRRSASLLSVDDAPRDEDVLAALRARVEAAGLDEVVATVSEPIRRDRERRTRGECRLGNFVADAYRWASGADVALQNTGGIRGGPPLSGAVTASDLVGVVPFEEPVVVAELSGEELRTVARQADGALVGGMASHWHAHVSGMSIRHDGTDATVRVGGEPVEPDRSYTLATSAYLLYADHEFPVLEEDHRVDALDLQYEILLEYARTRGVDPVCEGRVACRYDGR